MSDEDVRERIRENEQQILKIRGLLGEVAAVVWGDMVRRDNGLRKRVDNLETWEEGVDKWAKAIESRLNHYFDRERAETCLGLRALAEREEALYCEDKEETGEEVAVKTAQINAGATVGTAKWQAIAMIIGQLLTLAGIVIVALK